MKMNTETYNVITTPTVGNISSYCRLCLINNTKMKSLYSPLEEIIDDVGTLFDVMQKLSSTQLSSDPKYPSYLCLECISLVNIAYKVNRLMEMSQTQISVFFKEYLQTTKMKEDPDSASVEIISNKGKYNLKDVLIIEEDNKENTTFDGFLKNLGSVISADFVSKDIKKEKENLKEDAIHIVNLIPLSQIKEANDEENTNNQEPKTVHMTSDEFSTIRSRMKKYLQCDECSRSFFTKGSLKRHKENFHSKRSYLCQICGHISNGKNSLNNHMMLKHNAKRLSCEVCGRKYLSKSHLRHHMLMHKNERQFLCTVCGKNFNYGSSLDYHMRIHTGERKYKCTYCDRAFTMRGSLNRHLRTHTGLRPYKCSFCDKAFRSKGEVGCHEMIHTGFRPYHCKICGKGFTKTHNMKVHMLGHTGPFPCEFCQRTFIEVTCLKLHMKMSHGLNDYDISTDQMLIVSNDDIDFEDLGSTLIITTE